MRLNDFYIYKRAVDAHPEGEAYMIINITSVSRVIDMSTTLGHPCDRHVLAVYTRGETDPRLLYYESHEKLTQALGVFLGYPLETARNVGEYLCEQG